MDSTCPMTLGGQQGTGVGSVDRAAAWQQPAGALLCLPAATLQVYSPSGISAAEARRNKHLVIRKVAARP